MDLAVVKYSGEDTGRKVSLSSEIFGIEPNDHAIYLDVKSILANQRQGTAKSKQRAEIKGSSKKLKKQKGTGGARAGNIKNPLYRGGGRIFGPTPSDKKTLVILGENKKNIVLSGRNVQNTKVITASQLNTYDLMNADQLILVESGVELISNILNKQ